MKKSTILAVVLAALPASAQFITDDPDEPLRAPLEAHAAIGNEFAHHNDYINTILMAVRSHGYRCDTISGIERAPGRMSFEIDCNRHRLNYLVGGLSDSPTVTPEQ